MEEVVDYDLKYSTPPDVGLRFTGREKTKELMLEDVPAVLNSIDLMIESFKKKSGKQGVNLRVKGWAPIPVLLALTWGIAQRDDIIKYYFTTPHGLGCLIGEGEKDE